MCAGYSYLLFCFNNVLLEVERERERYLYLCIFMCVGCSYLLFCFNNVLLEVENVVLALRDVVLRQPQLLVCAVHVLQQVVDVLLAFRALVLQRLLFVVQLSDLFFFLSHLMRTRKEMF